MNRPSLLLAAILLLSVHPVVAQDACPVQGVWQLESASIGDQSMPSDTRSSIKLVTATHWAFVAQSGGPSTLETRADTLEAFRTRGFGGGTYEVTEDTYTETLDYFMDPSVVGREITFSCRIEGDRWYHETVEDFTLMEGAGLSGRLVEVWRRIG